MEIESMRWHNPISRAAAAMHTYLRAAAAAAAAATAIHIYPRAAAAAVDSAAAAAVLKFHLKISHINIIYDKTVTSQQNSD